eukprot:SM000124S25916  [mRNA]  locus=s124:64022:64910:- [translate_table: standard]
MRRGDVARLNADALQRQAKGLDAEYKRLQQEVADSQDADAVTLRVRKLQEQLDEARSSKEKLQAELEARTKETRTAEANTQAIKKQVAGLQLEFDRMLDENEGLRSQLASFDSKYSRSEDKKRS